MCSARRLTLVTTSSPALARAPFRVAIVGGGFAGAAAALRSIEAGSGPLAITVIEPRATLGRGIAYSTTEPGHLMNGPARSLSLYPEAPLHFVRWLEAEAARGGWMPPEGTGWEASQPPRRHFGSYVETRLAATAADSFGRVRLRHRRDRAVGIGRLGREFVIALAGGGTIVADAVVLASGVFQNGAGRRLAGDVAGDPCYVADPYAEGGFAGLAAAAEVVILGSGLAMLDALVSLERAGFRGRVRAVSRRGGLVEPRRPVEAADDFLAGADPTLRGLVRKVQEARRRIAAEGGDWQQLVPAVRAATPGLWVRLGDADRERFVRHLQGVWKSCIHLAPIETHRLAERMRAEGRLTVEAGEVAAIERGEAARLAVAVSGPAGDRRLEADGVVDCLGHSADWSARSDPLVRSLLDRGLARRHATGLGIDVDPLTLAVSPAASLSAGGSGSQRLFAIGHPLRGSVWESTSVREIALQAKSLGETIAAISEHGAERPPVRRGAREDGIPGRLTGTT